MQSDHGGTVPVVQAYAFGKYLGHLKLTFDQEGNVMEAKGNPILLDSNVPEGRAARTHAHARTHTHTRRPVTHAHTQTHVGTHTHT